jgi:hypothetical protein
MFRAHVRQHRLPLPGPDVLQDIHQDWLVKLIKGRTLERHDPAKGRKMYTWVFQSMYYHFYSSCLASKFRKYCWQNHEVPVSSLGDGHMTLDDLYQASMDETSENDE